MTGETPAKSAAPQETDAVLGFYNKTASKYNRQISLFERILFGGGREWVCSQAEGDLLEIATGTGRNLRHYPPEVRLTATEAEPSDARARPPGSRFPPARR